MLPRKANAIKLQIPIYLSFYHPASYQFCHDVMLVLDVHSMEVAVLNCLISKFHLRKAALVLTPGL